jgi:hypothetical protein
MRDAEGVTLAGHPAEPDRAVVDNVNSRHIA